VRGPIGAAVVLHAEIIPSRPTLLLQVVEMDFLALQVLVEPVQDVLETLHAV
jgi:hypothetical protein